MSIVSQYNIDPYDVEEMKHSSIAYYVGGLRSETPLVNLVHIRQMTTQEARENKLTPSQMKERQRWFTYLESVKQNKPYIDPFEIQFKQ